MRFKKYNFSALYAPSPTSRARKEAAPSSSPSSQSLSPQLLSDLLDPTNTPHQLCQLHNLTLAQLAAITDAPEFQSAIAALQTINTTRSRAIAPSAAIQSTAVHQQIATAALCAADDINQLAAAKDPKLANAKSKLLDTARKATTAAAPTQARLNKPTRSTPSKTSPTRCAHRHEPSTNARPRLPIAKVWAGMLSGGRIGLTSSKTEFGRKKLRMMNPLEGSGRIQIRAGFPGLLCTRIPPVSVIPSFSSDRAPKD